jgi:hypothetical protein
MAACATSCVRPAAQTALAARNMVITKEFLVSEIESLEHEAEKARTFLIQAQATMAAYQMLIRKLDDDQPNQGA